FGRYCSISSTARVVNRNHDADTLSLTPYLYDEGYAGTSLADIPFISCNISDDVWIGHGAIILPGAQSIGRGAIVGAGAIVTKDVEPYTIVAGNPARVIRRRFSEAVVERVESLRWWEWEAARLVKFATDHPEQVFHLKDDV
ncbi:MAG: chloramphenicol acetyltransferase, partial [Brevundimonas sp.]|uniref:CatB-related O-acetyltransferase n=1 Tax=Brevundimonas sp. TaxID=1871086 RepID=UPI000DB66FE8